MVDHQNVNGEAQGAHQHQQIAGSQREVTLDAQQIQRDHRQHHGDPCGQIDLPLEEQAEHRHQHHIQGGDEARLTGVCTGGKTRLLEVGGHRQRRTAADTAEPHLAVGGLALDGGQAGLVLVDGVKNDDQHQQRHHRDIGADGVEGKGVDGVGAQILRHKSGAPDEGGQNGKQHLAYLIVFHGSFPFCMYGGIWGCIPKAPSERGLSAKLTGGENLSFYSLPPSRLAPSHLPHRGRL